LIDETAELFKGELGDIHTIESMSLRELITRRDIRVKRKLKEAEEEKNRQAKLEKERERDAFKNKVMRR
jgi:hypothetical protein